MRAFVGKAQEEYKEESQKNSLLVLAVYRDAARFSIPGGQAVMQWA